jgi:hypothetical protein
VSLRLPMLCGLLTTVARSTDAAHIPRMADKASQAGWVVEVTRTATAIGEVNQTAHFDVAIKSALEAVVVATRKSGFVGGASGRTVRPLSADEIEFMGLKPGEARPS